MQTFLLTGAPQSGGGAASAINGGGTASNAKMK
jgi:hypothetical protein